MTEWNGEDEAGPPSFTVEVFTSKGWEIVADELNREQAMHEYQWRCDVDCGVRLTYEPTKTMREMAASTVTSKHF